MLNLRNLAKSAVLAIALSVGVSGISATSGPVFGVSKAEARDNRHGWQRNHNWQRNSEWRKRHSWNRNRHSWNQNREWRRGHGHRRNWGNHRGWRDNWGWRDRSRAGIYLNFGLPAYRYVEPRYAVRPTYRASNSHVAWCYDRYRSYRAYDNTYKPYNGPRRQCWSPYS